jgi:hypothetical protein
VWYKEQRHLEASKKGNLVHRRPPLDSSQQTRVWVLVYHECNCDVEPELLLEVVDVMD